MPVRLFATPGVSAAVNPAAHPSWYWVSGSVTRALSLTKTSQTDDYLSVDTTPTFIANIGVLYYKLVSPPIAAGPLGGTFAGQFYALDSNNSAMRSQVFVRVVSNDGLTFRGTLYAGDFGAYSQAWSTTDYLNRAFPRAGTVALSPVMAQVNDRVVVEIGALVVVAQPSLGYIVISDDASLGNLTTGDTGDSPGPPTKNTWVFFSDNLFTTRVGPIMRTSILE